MVLSTHRMDQECENCIEFNCLASQLGPERSGCHGVPSSWLTCAVRRRIFPFARWAPDFGGRRLATEAVRTPGGSWDVQVAHIVAQTAAWGHVRSSDAFKKPGRGCSMACGGGVCALSEPGRATGRIERKQQAKVVL